MDDQRLDKMQSSESFQMAGASIKDAIFNKGRVERERKLAEKKAAKKLARMRKKEDKKRHRAAVRAQPLTLLRKVKRFIVTIVLLIIGGFVWTAAMGFLMSGQSCPPS